MDNLEDKKFPIGKFEQPESYTDRDLDKQIEVLKLFPSKLSHLLKNFSDEQLDTQYREGGWTVRQLVNHLADSHMQSFLRFKWALTEDNPTIKPYEEAKWAELQDTANSPLSASLQILEGLHCRWVHLLKTITNKEFARTYFHPEQNKSLTLRENVAFYAWHCNHHYAHIANLMTEKGWV